MSLLGIDVGTTGCKAAVFSEDGRKMASGYEEYEIQRSNHGWAELDANEVWAKVKRTLIKVISESIHDPVTALAVTSLGESVVPVTKDRSILGSSILNFDVRGEEFIENLGDLLIDERLYEINGNTLGNQYGITKLMWIKKHRPDIYKHTFKFLPWASFVSFMLGAEPVVDYSLANRILLFDVDREVWSDEIIELTGLDRNKLPDTVPSGVEIGRIPAQIAEELGLSRGVTIAAGAHDQCANAVGCGVINAGSAVFGMGTYICITPVFSRRRAASVMIERGLNTEHHAIPNKYVCFIYNQGGSLVKWFRDTFAFSDHKQAVAVGEDIYPALFSEIPEGPSGLMVLPHFAITGPPDFIKDSSGVIVGLCLETQRGDILKGIIEGVTYYLKECVDSLPPTGIEISDYRPVGGGSKSDKWVQICADIMGRPFARPMIKEAGALGAAIIAGVGCKTFNSFEEGVEASVKFERIFEPDLENHQRYTGQYEAYKQMWPIMSDYLGKLTANNA